jgi:hypothetical protein
MRLVTALAVLLSLAAFAQGPAPLAPLPPLPPPPPDALFRGPPGIPPQVAQKLGLSSELVKKVRDLGFDANEALIPLEGDLKRAQLDLERTLAQAQVEEAAVLLKAEAVSRTELAVRKNRLTLLVRIRKLVGPETWEKLQGEFPGPGMLSGAPGVRREVRVIKHGDGTTEVNETHE